MASPNSTNQGRKLIRPMIGVTSLPNAEIRKNPPEQILVAELAGDFAERMLHLAQFLGGEFTGACLGQGRFRGLQ